MPPRISKVEHTLIELQKYILGARKTELVVYTNTKEIKRLVEKRFPEVRVEIARVPGPPRANLPAFLGLTDDAVRRNPLLYKGEEYRRRFEL